MWRHAEQGAVRTRRGWWIPVLLAATIVVSLLALRGPSDDRAGLSPGPPGLGQSRAATGPLRVLPENRRYFTDGSGRAVLLVGSHTWNNVQDWGDRDPPPAFDYGAYLDVLTSMGHNFARLWAWENARWSTGPGDWHYEPVPYLATGPGVGEYGGPRFDLNRFDQGYFEPDGGVVAEQLVDERVYVE